MEQGSSVGQRGETERLTAGLASGEENAFREFHARYFDRLYQFLLAVTRGSDDETQEALQQTFVRVARHARVFDSEEIFWSWLKAVARSAARDGGRKRRRYSSLLARFAFWRHVEANYPPEEDASGFYDLLEDGMRRLASEDRDLLRRKYIDGETTRDLAARAGISEKAVESRLLRARRDLRQRMLNQLKTP